MSLVNLSINVLLVMVVAALFLQNKNNTNKTNLSNKSDQNLLGATTSVSQTPSPTPTIMPSNISPTQSTRLISPTPTAGPNNDKLVDNFIYPGSTINNKSDNSLDLNSNDNTTTITQWYKDRINSMGMKAKSFSQTTTNGNVNNVLAAAGFRTEIRVEITKRSNETTTKIVVTIKSS